MNFLITGGTGFLGSYICKQLLTAGHKPVCYDYAVNSNSIQQVLTEEELEKVTCIQGDVRDAIKIIRTCVEQKIDVIIHTAGMLNDACGKDVPAAIETNLVGTVNMFEAARICGIKRVVWASSSSAIGNPDFIKDELLANDCPHKPITIYGTLKDAAEFIGKHYNETYGLETVGIRYVSIFGKARIRGASNFMNELVIKPAMGQPSIVPNGDGTPNLIYVKDAANITVLAATVPSEKLTSHAYFAGGDIEKISDLKDYVMELLPDAQIELIHEKQSNVQLMENFDMSLERKDLGYVQQYTTREGIKETIELIQADC